MSREICLSLGKVTIRDTGGTVLGTVKNVGLNQYEYASGRIKGYAATYADAVAMLRKIATILPRTPKEIDRARTEGTE